MSNMSSALGTLAPVDSFLPCLCASVVSSLGFTWNGSWDAIGIGLAAACGFRVFVPPLVLSVAALSGHLHLAPVSSGWAPGPRSRPSPWPRSWRSSAYYFPWVDNLLDTAATPIAVVAGIVMTASCVSDVSPFLKWTLAVIAGGGAAGLVQILTVKTRALSSLFTGGLANWVVSTLGDGLLHIPLRPRRPDPPARLRLPPRLPRLRHLAHHQPKKGIDPHHGAHGEHGEEERTNRL